MSIWPRISLGELCEVNIGRTPQRDRSEYWGAGHPWLSIADMNQGKNIRWTKESITDAAVSECNCRAVAPHTVLLSFKLSIGKVSIAGIPLYTNEAIAALPILNGEHTLVPEYLYRALQFVDFTTGLDRAAKGLTLNKPKLLGIRIPVPPLPEQRRIAAILDKADELRAKHRAALEQLNCLRTSLFVNSFGDPRSILDRWRLVDFGASLSFVTSGSRGWAKYYKTKGALFLRIQNVRRDELSLDDVAYVDAPDTAEANRTRVQTGDVLLSITADLGRTAVIPPDIGAAYINQHLAILRTEAFVPRFLSAFLASDAGRRQILGRNRQGVKAGLNFDDIRSLKIPNPPRPLQCEFERQMTNVDRLERLYRRCARNFDAAFDSIQQRAFAGEL